MKNIILKLIIVIAVPSLLMAQTWNFNSIADGYVPGDLIVTNGAVQNSGSGSGGSGYFSGDALNFFGFGTRSVTMPAVNTAGGGSTLAFKMIYGNNSNGGELLDSGENVALYYSTNGGSTWTKHTDFALNTYQQSSYTAVSINLTGNLAASSIIFKLEQVSHSGPQFDQWAIDDLVLNTTDVTAPTITATAVASDNSTISVTFSEAVYTATGANTAVVVGDFALSISGGQATLSSATPSSISKSGNVYTLGLAKSGTANGSETVTVVPASTTAIYDAADNAASTTQSNNTVSLNDRTVAGTPTGLTAVSFYGGAQLNWTAVSGVSKYYVYYSTGTSYTKLSTEPTVDSLDISTLAKGTSYYYKVTSVKSNGTESNKSTATGATKALRGIYVTTSGSDSNSGYSSAKALATLKEAVSDAATLDTIYIAAGTYTFSSSSNGNITIDGSKNLVIKGSGSGSTILDANSKNRHFYFSAYSSSTLLDTTFKIMNLTLKNGKPTGTNHGGSVYMTGFWNSTKGTGHEPLFQNVIFDSNHINYSSNTNYLNGGAVYAYRSLPYFRDVTFKYNSANHSGGAVYFDSPDTNKTITFERTYFLGNHTSASLDGMDGRGGAVYLTQVGKVIFESTTFDSNYVAMNGGCCGNRGGAIFAENFYDSLIVRDSKFRANKVYKPSGNDGGNAQGGAIYVSSGYGNVVVTNSLFDSNIAEAAVYSYSSGSSDREADGGAIRIELQRFSNNNSYTFPYETILINNTFVNNKALGSGSNNYGRGGGIRLEWAQKATLFNNVFWDNRGNNFGSDSARHEIYGYDDGNSQIYLGNNNWQHAKTNANSYGSNNIDREPQFYGGSDDKYKLSDGSFLIGAGVKTFEGKTAPTKDILGNTRPSGSSTDNPDIGAYENSLAKTTYPDKVAGLTATASNKSAILSWTANSESNISKYAVYKSTTTGFTPARSDSVGESTSTSFTVTGLTNGTAYYIKVKAINSSNQAGDYSDQASVTPEYKGVGGWHVAVADSGGTSSNEGSKSSPMLYLSDAVTASASGDTILIGGGTHSYTTSSKWNISFDGSKTLVIKGAGKDKTIFDAQQKNRHFYFSANSGATLLDTTFKIMDMTLKNGKPTGNHGGSVYMTGYWSQPRHYGHSPLFQNVIFESNQTRWTTTDYYKYGGAVYATSGPTPYFRDVTFKNNLTDARGGAVYIENSDTLKTITFERTNFINNKASQEKDGSYAQGGATYFANTGKVVFESSTFDSNYVEMNGDCCSNYGGAIALNNTYDTLIVRNSKFRYNKVYAPSGNNGGQAKGGAIYADDLKSDLLIENSLFEGNSAEASLQTYSNGSNDNEARGGAVWIDIEHYQSGQNYLYPHSSIFVNNTFVNNKAFGSGQNAGRGGGLYLEWANKITAFNNILFGNRGNNFGSDSTYHEVTLDQSSMELLIGYNNFQHAAELANSFGSNNTSRDPQFLIDGSSDQYKLSDASFLIGAGTKSFGGQTAPSKDILGNSRPSGTSTDNPDMGAYENSLAKTAYPDKVADLVTKGSDQLAVLSWTANSETNISKYAVYQSTTTGFTPAQTDSVGESTSATFTSNGLTNGTTYYFRVKAINSSNQSGEFSDQASAEPKFEGVGGWHVAVADSGGVDGNDGSKSKPMLYLTNAVTSAASGDTILIGGGTHSYTSSSKLNISFDGSKTLVIKGAGKDKTILDANQKHRHFYFSTSSGGALLDTTFKIMDMTLKNGRPSGPGNGGSVYMSGYWDNNSNTWKGHEPLFRNVIFESNQIRESLTNRNLNGGAIYIYGSTAFFSDVSFIHNTATRSGGAVYVENADTNKTITFERTTFIGNGIEPDWDGANYQSTRGGAVYSAYGGKMVFESSVFDSNYVQLGGDCCSSGGGAIFQGWTHDSLIVRNSKFRHNRVYKADDKNGGQARGGAIYVSSIETDMEISSSLFLNNSAEAGRRTWENGSGDDDAYGGALEINLKQFSDSNGNMSYPYRSLLINNTFVGNKAFGSGNAQGQGAALRYEWGQSTAIINNIFWADTANRHDVNSYDYIIQNLFNNNSEIISGHNDVDHRQTMEIMNTFGESNISKDPKFLLDGSDDEYQLTDASRLIGLGALTYEGFKAPSTDVMGNPRPTVEPDHPDIGAYENANLNPPFPDKVIALVADPADQSVILSWDANLEANLTKYIIYQSLTQGFTPTSLDSLGESVTNTFTAAGLTNRTNYYYRVAAVNDKGNVGELSDEVIGFPEYEGPVWWVAIDGNNTNDGNEANPLGSLSHAADIAFDGDTIKIKAGTYEDNQSTTINGKSLTIIGVDGYQNTIIDNKGMFVHFGLSNSVIRIKGLSLINGGGGKGGSMDVQNVDSLFIDNSYFGNNSSDSQGGAIRLEQSSAYINNSQFHNNRSKSAGGAIYSVYSESHELIVKNSHFEDNRVTMNSGGDMHASGGAISSSVHSKILHSFFKKNLVDMQTGGNESANGGAVSINGSEVKGLNEIRGSVFIGNRLYGDGTQTGNGGALLISAAVRIQNNVFANNGVNTPGGGDGTVMTANGGSQIFIINNTMYDNDYPGGYSSNNLSFHNFGADGVDLRVFNNVLYTDDSILPDLTGDGSIVKKLNNVLKDNRALASIDFKNHLGNDFSLRPGSDLIDGGITFHSDGNAASDVYAPIKDLRDYYRVGDPDVGAFEFGASKYMLALADDIVGDLDTTFVSLDQDIKFTLTTNDIYGDQVISNEPVTWDIYPNKKYVTITSADTTTAGGDAEAILKVSDVDKSKGFRFRIHAFLGSESMLSSEIYVIEEIVTGAPPSVANLTVSPTGWSSDNNFTLTWENPAWDRDLIGVALEIQDDLGQVHNQLVAFPESSVLTTHLVSMKEAGIYDVSVWLVDELGNEDPATRLTVSIQLDNVPPNEFFTHGPASDEWAPPEPTFYFDDTGDYPSGVEEYALFINDNLFQSYGGVNTAGDGAGYVDIDNPLSDGYYNWYMETKDYAGNVTRSDTSYFGVDTQPPTISHSNPLTIVDEGVDSPPINAGFSDVASGVKIGRLYYRTAGSGGSWKTKDVLSGSTYIQASDVHHSGIEYYIISEDNLGNQSQWPESEPYQSVQVRSASNISSNSRWTNGIPGGTEINAYQLFSVPFDVGNGKSGITSVMGQSDKFMYRLFKYVGGEEPWQEDPSSITMGEAYFFIFDPTKYEVDGAPTKITFNFGQGTSTITTPPYEKSISAGDWNLIGSPYNFDMILSNVYTEDGTAIRDAGSLFGFSNGSWSSVSSIKPWQGYAFKSTSATKLIFDGRGIGFGKIAKELDYENIPQDYNEWIIDITAATGYARDELNAVGVRNLAKDGYDPFDEFEPPTLPGDVVLRIDNRDRVESPDIYSKDIREPNDTGHYWDLQVFAPTNGDRTYLTFEGLGYVPEEYDIFLINKTTKQAKNLEWESSYRFANTGSDDYLKQDFRLLIGTKQFVEDNNAGVNLYPDAFTLAQNYPNPFNPQTSIMISLEEDAQLNLIIYNLLGEEVTHLAMNEHRPAGYYTFIWNGTNAMGSKVSTGVYFYHAMIRDAQGKVVLNKTRKMIFLK